MLNIYIEKDTPADEITIAGNALIELGKLRASKQAEVETTKPPKKTKAQPVTLTSTEPEAALPESLPTPEVLEVKKPEPVQEPEPEVVEAVAVTEPAAADPVLDLVGLRAALAPIIKDKKDELTALVKTYGDSLPKIDPALYPEILAKAKEL